MYLIGHTPMGWFCICRESIRYTVRAVINGEQSHTRAVEIFPIAALLQGYV